MDSRYRLSLPVFFIMKKGSKKQAETGKNYSWEVSTSQ
jgi:hypothetical protein